MANSQCVFIKTTSIKCGVVLPASNCGQFSIVPVTRETVMKNIDRQEYFSFTNVQHLRYRRNRKLDEFLNTYRVFQEKKLISIFCYVINAIKFPNRSEKVKSLKRKLHRLGIEHSAHFIVNDIDENGIAHYHLFLVTERVSKEQIREIASKSNIDRGLNFIMMNDSMALVNYIKGKELYIKKNGRSYSTSRHWNLPESALTYFKANKHEFSNLNLK